MMALDEESLRRSFVRYHLARAQQPHREPFTKHCPLVSVCIATYNRSRLLTTRSLPSVLAQTYPNLEVIVVGDGCTDDTAEAVAALGDPRVRFENLPLERPDYGAHGGWYVAGTRAVNRALELARGDFVTHLDDDDEYLPERIDDCLRVCREGGFDFLFHSFLSETEGGWRRVESPDGLLRFATVTTSSTFYHRFFKDLPWDMEAWTRWQEPGDWNRYRKLALFKPPMAYLRKDLLRHHREGGNVYGGPNAAAGVAPTAAAGAPTAAPGAPTAARSGPLRLHIGCGNHRLQGWVNVDLDPASAADLKADVTRGLPFADGSVDAILTQHFIEHLTRAEGAAFLTECARLLRPGGLLRVSTPDLARVAADYGASRASGRLQCHWDDPSRYASACQVFNAAMDSERAWGHQYTYDEPELRLRLEQAGFAGPALRGPGEVDPAFAGLEAPRPPCLVFEARKAARL